MRRRLLRPCVLTAVAGVAFACASNGASGAAASASTRDGAVSHNRRDRSTISSDDLTGIQANNLFQVVERLHPEWLSGRNASTMGTAGGKATSLANEVQVYMDTQRTGTIDVLKQLAPNVANSVRYYTPSEAQAQFGNGNLNGAIQVITAKRP